MTVSGKWIEGVTPGSSVRDAAERSLTARLAAVQENLAPAAERAAEDSEHVHRLRVSTRRAVAAIDLYRKLLPGRRARRLTRRLKDLRRAAGHARDLDVLAVRVREREGPHQEALLADITRRREAAQPELVEQCQANLQKDKLRRRSEELIAKVRPRGKGRKALVSCDFAEWSRRRFRRIVKDTFAAAPHNTQDLAALHQFRIACKRLRYALELLSSAFPPTFTEEVYPLVERLQEHLGDINDHVVGSKHGREWSQATDDLALRGALDAHVENHERQLQIALEAFNAWWTPEFARELRAALLDPDRPHAKELEQFVPASAR